MSPETASGGWRAHLHLQYWRDGARTVALDRHEGPLRVLQRLYPEGDGICHHVMVHPPGGVAGGDVLEVQADLAEGSHAVITTPAATRFYRSAGRLALQAVQLRVASGARAEWLPLENIAYPGCLVENRAEIELAEGAEALGWDLLALGLPASGTAFDRGEFTQHLALRQAAARGHEHSAEVGGRAASAALWLERGRIAATDNALLESPLGWARRRVLATVWCAAGQPLDGPRRERLIQAARDCAVDDTMHGWTGATSPLPHVVVARALAQRVEPAMQWMCAVRAAWRREAWGLDAHPPRVWRT